MLSAAVLDVKEEQVKVKFDMDLTQPEESAYWYPWQPDMGNLAYCMPEKENVYTSTLGMPQAAGTGQYAASAGMEKETRTEKHPPVFYHKG